MRMHVRARTHRLARQAQLLDAACHRRQAEGAASKALQQGGSLVHVQLVVLIVDGAQRVQQPGGERAVGVALALVAQCTMGPHSRTRRSVLRTVFLLTPTLVAMASTGRREDSCTMR